MKMSLPDRLMNAPHWVLRLFFFLGVFGVLCFCYDDVLYRIFWNGYFTTNEFYSHDVTGHTGGALRYLSQFLNQVMRSPALGAALVSALLVALAYLNEKCFRLKDGFFVGTFLPSLLLLSLYTGIGYDIYMRIDTSFGLTSILGCLITLSLYLLYETSNHLRRGKVLVVAVIALLYPAAGFYALAALMLVTVDACLSRRNVAGMVGVMVGASIILPLLSDICMFDDELNFGSSALLLSSSYLKLRVLQILSLVALLLLPITKIGDKVFSSLSFYGRLISFLLCFGLCYVLSYRDNIFYSELKVSRQADMNDWKGILKECKKYNELSKTLNAYRVIALANTDKLSNNLFKINLPFAETTFSPYENYLFEDILFFQSGFFNSTTRVCVESWQWFGLSYRRLRFLALCALMKGEAALAKKYLKQMSGAFSLSDEVERLNLLLRDKSSFFKKYPEYARIVRRMPEENVLFKGGASVSRYFMCFSNLPVEDYELRLMSDLWECNLKAFAIDLRAYVEKHGNSIPDCIKEAAVIAVMSGERQSILSMAQVDEEMWNKVNGFFASLKTYDNDDRERAMRNLKNLYEKTYCFYYAFGNNAK